MSKQKNRKTKLRNLQKLTEKRAVDKTNFNWWCVASAVATPSLASAHKYLQLFGLYKELELGRRDA